MCKYIEFIIGRLRAKNNSMSTIVLYRYITLYCIYGLLNRFLTCISVCTIKHLINRHSLSIDKHSSVHYIEASCYGYDLTYIYTYMDTSKESVYTCMHAIKLFFSMEPQSILLSLH